MTLTITAEPRTIEGKKTEHLRADGKVPAVMYGFDTEPTNLTLDRVTMEKLYTDAGESSIIDLTLDKDTHSVLIQDIQRDPITDFIIHVDFRRIDMTKEVETDIPVKLVGEAPAVKELGGTLIQSRNEVEVKALPSALVRELTVSVEGLKTFDDTIRVSDIDVPEGMTILTEADRSVASVMPPRTQEEMDALDEEVDADVSGVEVEGEEAEGEEGEETSEGAEKAEEATEEKSE